MAKPYSYDLRVKVINAIELDGVPKNEVRALFKISHNTIDQWLNLKSQTGDFQAQPKHPPSHSHKTTDWVNFVNLPAFMEIKPKSRWPNCGMEISVHALSREP
jgi:Transposase